ncbi:MAG: hypothetical protein IPM35_20370 [Myxococcales bacterium]|nr:hypothetical protein [Myxococcales bacterium]
MSDPVTLQIAQLSARTGEPDAVAQLRLAMRQTARALRDIAKDLDGAILPGFSGGKFDTDNIVKEGLSPTHRALKYGGALDALMSTNPGEIAGRQDYAAKGGLKRAVGAGLGTAPGGLKLEGADTFSKAVADFGAKVAAMSTPDGGGKPNRGDKPTP